MKRWTWLGIAAAAAVLGSAGAVAAFVSFSDDANGGRVELRAAIVDQLSLTAPNGAFVYEATALLGTAGYDVDYFPGEQITVDFYRELPTRDYDMVLVRAHAGRRVSAEGITADLFTSEPYSSTAHVDEQRNGVLKVGTYGENAPLSEALFTIPAEFVSSEMRGKFRDATVVLMGCDVLGGEQLAQAFVERGAKAVVGWNESVSAPHTDAATLSLLRHLLQENAPIEQATAEAREELGPDPYYGAELLLYQGS